MKEMTIEEKAKAYDEAFRIAQELYNDPNSSNVGKGYIYTVFSKLKESEDDIRENCIAYIDGILEAAIEKNDKEEIIELRKILAWLEKQVTPQVRTCIEWVNTIDDACDKRYSKEYAHGEYCHEQSFKWGFQEGVEWLEKQGEQKPADKIEPKDYNTFDISFGAKDSELQEVTYNISKGFHAEIDKNKIIIKRIEVC